MFEAAEIAKFDKKERYEYEESLKAFRDLFSVIETAELRGEKRGEERGEKRGERRGLLIAARNFKQKGLPIADIAEATGLSEKEIQHL